MDSFEDILARVLAKKVDSVYRVAGPVTPRRPLRDPNTESVSFMADISNAVRNIKSPEVARAMARNADPDEMANHGDVFDSDSGDDASPFSAVKRRGNFRDDGRALGAVGGAAAAMVQSVTSTTKNVDVLSKTAEKFNSAVKDMAETATNSAKQMKGGDGGGIGDRFRNFMNSSSIADKFRGMFGGGDGGGGFGGGGIGGIGSFFSRMFGGGGGGAGGIAGGAGAAGGGGIPPIAGGAGAAGGAVGAAGGLTALAIATGGLILVVLAIAAAFKLLTDGITIAVKALYNLGMQGYETALRVSQWNGQLAGAKAQLDVGRMLRDIQTANSLAGSGERLFQAFNKLEQALRPITDFSLGIGMEFLATTINVLIDVFKTLTQVALAHARVMAIIADAMNPGAVLGFRPANMAVDAAQRAVNAMNNPGPPPIIGNGFANAFDRPIPPPRQQIPPINPPGVAP